MAPYADLRVKWRGMRRSRISPQTQQQFRAGTPGMQANFVINFCQILFDPKTRELQ
jgi:hypothetical protein